jgi:molybdopterin-guanine dinucleotide biosynthesis protein A
MQTDTMITIAIQAGGLSSRMGQDKGLMPFLRQPLIAHMASRVKTLADELIITTNQPASYAFLGLSLFTDLLPGSGALGGLYTALSAASQPCVVVVACDMPFVNPALLRAQVEMLVEENADVVIPRSPTGLEPLHAVYRRETCLPAIQGAIEAGERKMISWLPSVRARVMEPQEIAPYDPAFRSFINVNDPEDFRQAEELARQWE